MRYWFRGRGIPVLSFDRVGSRVTVFAGLLSLPGALHAQAPGALGGASLLRVGAADAAPGLHAVAVPALSTGGSLDLSGEGSREPDPQAANDPGMSHSLRGGLVGLGAGLLVGHLIKSSWRDFACTGPGCAPPTDFSSITAYVYLPLAGAALGALIGKALEPSAWLPSVSPELGDAGPTRFAWFVGTR